ncbi:winged helix-turn-helix domain-containing protein [Serratia fonticola]|uniref:winged helix-turn-helix domain-containing protein n=1 Tax=Serratia fonticola TaxID=47917 RepID=UPI0027FC776D|nr:winged helix-turn-helix domain-containing protein [Serratia fonticola]MDQ7211936.1 winged helix-turn-helix domain-containing protein [Serratia fonticola]HBE9082016.1 winged helix-turn-helix domain-containing protein [Serratia fonticola]HBE9092646.1 winged helix-turn-helix domain-containing protein [Serratia fonticola]HBE9154996.1 winged helix-turn-helix domain-containing protein [Serratia fonticola]
MMETLIKDRSKLKNYSLIVEGRTLKLNNSQMAVKLSKNQTKLLLCLINEIQEKQTIINYIWGSDKNDENESNYRQLVRRTREILEKNGFPNDTVLTIPNYGLCINTKLIEQQDIPRNSSIGIHNDGATL